MDSSWTLRGLLMDAVDSKGTASLIYLIKMNFNHYKNDCPERESNSEPFGLCKPTRQPAELTGHVHMALFRKYIMPTSRDTLRSINQPLVHPITNHNRIHHHHDPHPPPPRPSNHHHHHHHHHHHDQHHDLYRHQQQRGNNNTTTTTAAAATATTRRATGVTATGVTATRATTTRVTVCPPPPLFFNF